MKVPYIRAEQLYQDYFNHQAGGGLPVFIGGGLQGDGLGNILFLEYSFEFSGKRSYVPLWGNLI